ncbi:hypothetical protein KJE20_14403 [Pyrenophora tritici-repentis]|nr:hypothetical protein KJE20_14403 [Pyrenophora tritici-repentis]
MTSLTLRGGGVFSPEPGSVIGGDVEAHTAMLSRDRLFAQQGLLVPAWLLGGLKVFLSLSMSALVFKAAPAADTLWVGRTSVSVSRLGRLGLVVRADIVQVTGADVTRFRFRDGRNGGDRSFVRAETGLESCSIQPFTRIVFTATIEGEV